MAWTARLRLRHLEGLLSLAATQNLSRSASALNTTQPGLSKWLKDLEAEIGLTLFERHARGLRPTDHGLALIDHARRIAAHLDTMRDDMASRRDGGSGSVVVGTTGASASDTVPVAILKLLARLPGSAIRLIESTMDRLLEQLQTGTLDIAVGRTLRAPIDRVIKAEQLYVEPIHFIVRPGHPLLQRHHLGWDDLMRFRWVTWPLGTPISDALTDALAAAERNPPVNCIESNSATINMALLTSTDMLGVASDRSAKRYAQIGALHTLPLRLSGFGSVSMYWREDAEGRATVCEALACLRDVVAEHEVEIDMDGSNQAALAKRHTAISGQGAPP